ncbi:MAG TPA: hypothetical protein PLP86_09655, partial [Armatimonadota bacterium]|nr:hypothetical protein [Armatimonadota bacterium]
LSICAPLTVSTNPPVLPVEKGIHKTVGGRMLKNKSRITIILQHVNHTFHIHRSYLIALSLLISLVFALSTANSAQPAPGQDARSFFKSIVGSWIGTCEQSTDGEKAENKYFQAVIKQIDGNTFQGEFEYYRLDTKTGSVVPVGQSSFLTTIKPDGTVQNKITGKGTVLVNYKPKDQKHDLSEVLTCIDGSSFQGKGTGTVSVSGMPLGLGKNGKVSDATSNWSLKNGVLSIDQNLKVGFKALFIKKSFKMTAHYTAKRGTNVASIIPKAQAAPTGAGSSK